MGLWTELGKALGELAMLNFKAEEKLPVSNFYKNRIQKLEKDGKAIHERINKIDEARSRVPSLGATPSEHYMEVTNVTQEIRLLRVSITALRQHMDIDIRVKQERERVMGGSATGRVDRGQEPTQMSATVGGNVMEAFHGPNVQRLLQPPGRSISTQVTTAPPAQAEAGELLLNDHISTGLFVTPTNNRNRSPSANPGSAAVVLETPSTVFRSLCLCTSCSQKFGSPASTRNNVLSSPELGTPSSSYSSHSPHILSSLC